MSPGGRPGRRLLRLSLLFLTLVSPFVSFVLFLGPPLLTLLPFLCLVVPLFGPSAVPFVLTTPLSFLGLFLPPIALLTVVFGTLFALLPVPPVPLLSLLPRLVLCALLSPCRSSLLLSLLFLPRLLLILISSPSPSSSIFPRTLFLFCFLCLIVAGSPLRFLLGGRNLRSSPSSKLGNPLGPRVLTVPSPSPLASLVSSKRWFCLG